MPKEAEIRKKAVQILEKEKFICWYPAKVKYKQNDIFGVFDLVCWQKRTANIKFVQLTTLSNLSARRKKIKDFFKKNKLFQQVSVDVEIWGWNKKRREFKKEKFNIKRKCLGKLKKK